MYREPVRPENAVHSMEHGAVWITYSPDLPDPERRALEDLAGDQPYLLVSLWEDDDLPAPIVLSAWGAQLPLNDLEQPAIDDFLTTYLNRPNAPERGGRCTGGFGGT